MSFLQERSALWGAILEVEEAGDDVERFDDADRPATLASSEPKPAAKDLDRFGDGSDEERDVEMPGGKSVAAGRQEDENQGYDMRKRCFSPNGRGMLESDFQPPSSNNLASKESTE